MQEFETLKVRSEGAVLFAQIDAPPINLLNAGLVRDLVSLIRVLDDGEPYRVVVFSSANPDFFIAHVDINQVAEYRQAAAELTGDASLGLLLRRLSTTRAVTIAEVNGRVRGAGNEFVMACDMSFASIEHGLFAQFENSMGLVPGAGGIQYLTRAMGRGRALEAMLGAADFDATLAERYGWINRALPESELSAFVAQLAHRIGRFPRESLANIKERVHAITLAHADDFRADSDWFGAAVRTEPVQRRLKTLLDNGMQSNSELELRFAEHLSLIVD